MESESTGHKQRRSWHEGEERFRALIQNSTDIITIHDADGTTIYETPSASRILGYPPDALIGKSPFVSIHPKDVAAVREAFRAVVEGGWRRPYPVEFRFRRADGSWVWLEGVGANLLHHQGIDGIVLTSRDITSRKHAEKRLTHLAQYDSLTGLPNRSLFRDRLSMAMARVKRNEQMLALMFLDLDRFKEINDTLGHSAGDEVLQAFARLLKKSLREVDTLARLGGDEFTILLENIIHIDQVTGLVQRVQAVCSDPIVVHGREIFVTASIGITFYPNEVDDIDKLLQTADIALYRAKEEGRNTYVFYKPEMNARAVERLDLEGLLRHALERQEFVLHYQPKVAVKSGRIVGVEALLRWNSKERGHVPPDQFIPLAEETGLIVPISEFVLKTACVQTKAWQNQGIPPLVMSVNLSPRQFRQKDLAERIARVLSETGLAPRFLELEITESMIMHHADRAIAILQQLHQLGVQLSVDDFGTGYSSLAYLKRFPVQKLKIDKSFVQDIHSDADNAAIVTAVIAMAKSLGLGVTAEGVETKEQLAFLTKLRCDEYQGYYFSRPVPAEEFAQLVQTPRRGDEV